MWKLYGLNTVKLPSYYPSFDSEIPGGVYILSFDIKSLNFMTDGYVKKSSHERFFRGIAWLRDLFKKAQWYEDFRSILVCASICYVKQVWRVLLARSKCGRKKEIACKFTPTLVYGTGDWGRENYNRAWQKLFEAENIY